MKPGAAIAGACAGFAIVIGGILVAKAIPSPADKAEQRYRFLQLNNASPDDLCAAARAAEAAQADAGRAEGYRLARERREYDCLHAQVTDALANFDARH